MTGPDLPARIVALVVDAQAIDKELRAVRDDEGAGHRPRNLARYLQRDAETLARAAQRMADRLEAERRP